MRTEIDTTSNGIAAERRAFLADVMARLPGDDAMEVALYQHFGDELRATLVALAREHGLAVPPPEELEGLVFDACGVMRTVARWWKPDRGALPWSYGRQRLLSLLRRHQGPRCRPLLESDLVEGSAAVVAAAPDDRPVVQVLDRLVADRGDPMLDLFHDALSRLATRDQELLLLYAEQQAAGDPSPSHTVATLVERRPDAVRQAVSRGKRRLRRLAIEESRYRALLALPVLAADAPTRRRAA